ncbi:MAG TPA: winged helix-turn-helix domain-containing protein [Candidatus Dormibacteraeota bacterium]|nr:winged helix-turn-helix domain-containing protein [Candidatus Dormibacteraeota bacterium]
MEIPDYQTLMLPLLKALSDRKEHLFRDLVSQLEEELAIPEAMRLKLTPSGTSTIVYNRIAWARTHLGHAGLLKASTRGVIVITDEGCRLLAENPAEISRSLLMRYPSYVEFINGSKPSRSDRRRASKVSRSRKRTPTFDDRIATAPQALPGQPSLEDQITAWLMEGEGSRLEYQKSLHDDGARRFADTVASFANGLGGVILLGVDNDATVVGYDAINTQNAIINLIRSDVREYVEPEIHQVRYRHKSIWVIRIPEGNQPPYQSSGRVMVRANATNRPAIPDEIRRMVTKTMRQTIIVPNITIRSRQE